MTPYHGPRAGILFALLFTAGLAGCTSEEGGGDAPLPAAALAAPSWTVENETYQADGNIATAVCAGGVCAGMFGTERWTVPVAGDEVIAIHAILSSTGPAYSGIDVQFTATCQGNGDQQCDRSDTVTVTGPLPLTIELTDLAWTGSDIRYRVDATGPIADLATGTGEPVRLDATHTVRHQDRADADEGSRGAR